MADKKVSQLTALTGANTASGDLLYIVDVSEPLPADQSKKITLTEFQSAPISAGTANGLLYLNASKVPTSGAGLTYDGTDLTVVGAVNAGSVNTTTLDLTNLEVTNIKAKDGTAAATIADATGKITVSTELAVDNLNLSGNTLASTDTNGNIVIAPNGTGDVQLDADTVRVGDANSNALITTNGTGDLVLNTNSGTNSGFITIEDGVNGNIIIAPNGTGQVQITNAALDLTTIEVTNIKAKDGTAAMTLADSTGVTTFAVNPVLTSGTANGVAFLNGSKVLTTGSALTFDGTNLGVGNALGATFESANDAGRLVIGNGSGNEGLTVFSGSTGLGIVDFADASSGVATYAGFLQYSHSSDAMLFGTGSAEQMRLTSTGLGIGTSSPTEKLNIVGGDVLIGTDSGSAFNGDAFLRIQSSSNAYIGIKAGTAASAGILFGDTDDSFVGGMQYSNTDNALFFNAGNAERLRITSSGNVGIGTSSPASSNGNVGRVLQAAASGNTSASFAVSTAGTNIDNAGIFEARATAQTSGADRIGQIYIGRENTSTTALSGYIAFGTSSGGTFASRMRLDASGNLGLGVTPSAWGSAYKAIQLYFGGGPFTSAAGAIGFTGNCFHNGTNWIYTSSNAATRYELGPDGGNHRWFTAPSGTAGNAISFTQAMTLDASGNLVVNGTSSINSTYKIQAGDAFQSISSSLISITDTATVYRGTPDGSGFEHAKVYSGRDATQWTYGSYLAFYTEGKNSGATDTSAERMRLDPNGNLGLGVTPSAWDVGTMRGFQIGSGAAFAGDVGLGYRARILANAYFGSGGYKYLNNGPALLHTLDGNTSQYQWFTAPSGTAGNAITFTQAMTLAASGNLLIGTTTESGSGRLRVVDSVRIADSNTETNALLTTVSATSATIETRYSTPLVFGTSATERARITSGGDFQTASGNSVMVGGTAARATTAGTNRVDIFDGTAPVGTLANGVSFYSASGEANVMDAAGNATLLSPHDAATNEWIFRSKHTPTGKVLKIDVERLLKFVNDHFGLDAVHEFIED